MSGASTQTCMCTAVLLAWDLLSDAPIVFLMTTGYEQIVMHDACSKILLLELESLHRPQ